MQHQVVSRPGFSKTGQKMTQRITYLESFNPSRKESVVTVL